MKQLSSLARLVFAIVLCFSQYAHAQEDILKQLQGIAIIEQKFMMPMRDGVRLATDIYRPKTDKPVPIIFSKTPYNFNGWGDGEARPNSYKEALEAVKRGYAYVVQNERGKFFSEGEWDILGPPTTDGYDAFSWMSKQPWSNGKIGTLGCSSTAEWQMAVAALDHPAHAAMVPMSFGAGLVVSGRSPNRATGTGAGRSKCSLQPGCMALKPIYWPDRFSPKRQPVKI